MMFLLDIRLLSASALKRKHALFFASLHKNRARLSCVKGGPYVVSGGLVRERALR